MKKSCINPFCSEPAHPQNQNNLYCRDCGSDLLLEGKYRVIDLLSDKGGFANVYDVKEQGEDKILKVLKPQHNNEAKAVELFQREAEVLAKFNHRGIPKIDSYFNYKTKDGSLLHCIVMEKIDGVDLEQWLRQQNNKPVSQENALAWLKQLAIILELVHSKELFHRDIKPSNIMLRSQQPNQKSSEDIVLIDFGTAREATATYFARIGSGNGVTAVISKGYTPPEQEDYQAVPQSDFFALGRTFVHLLTGKPPEKFYDPDNKIFNWRFAAKGVSPILADFIDELMAVEISDRPLTTKILLERIEKIESQLKPRKNIQIGLIIAAIIILSCGVALTILHPQIRCYLGLSLDACKPAPPCGFLCPEKER